MSSSPENPEITSGPEVPLQLLLFVDKRSSATEQVEQIHSYLTDLSTNYSFTLQVIDVGEQPYLAEHFKLVATPALVKNHPEPRQTIAGKNLVTQLKNCWPYWQQSVDSYRVMASQPDLSAIATDESEIGAVAYSAELIQLSDQIFHLRQEKAVLQEQLRFKDQIIAMLAHDLRNPLTAAAIALDTLELSYAPGDARAAHLTPELMAQLMRHARTQTHEINRMVTDLLQAAQNTSAGFQIQPKKLELRRLCQEVLDQMRSHLEAKSQQLKIDVPHDLPCAYADEDRVRQVMINLLDNAIKYTPEGSLIQIAMLHRTTQKIQVSVCDNGPGIPVENQEQIFEDQFRLERDHNQTGYGIGLALCRRIIQTHYGQIWVDSKPNRGSCFHFTLPVYQA